MSPLLRIDDLGVRFGDLPAVQELSLDLPAGGRLALMGESGSGKTSVALALGGLLPEEAAVSGHIDWPGLDGAPAPGRDVGFVFQDPMSSLNPVLTIGEQVAEVLVTHRGRGWPAAGAEAVRLLARVGLPDPAARARDYPHRLSGGQRQRVAIAMAIAAGPRLLIADEPTTALDTIVQAEIVALIDRLAGESGMALLLITHDLALAALLADQAAILYAGRLVEAGPIQRLLTAPRHPYTRGLVASSLDVDLDRRSSGRLAEIAGAFPEPGEIPAGCPFAPRCPHVMPRCRERFPAWRGRRNDGVACVLHHA
jgi:peptide/nickel transport system ATP-binding protein